MFMSQVNDPDPLTREWWDGQIRREHAGMIGKVFYFEQPTFCGKPQSKFNGVFAKVRSPIMVSHDQEGVIETRILIRPVFGTWPHGIDGLRVDLETGIKTFPGRRETWKEFFKRHLITWFIELVKGDR